VCSKFLFAKDSHDYINILTTFRMQYCIFVDKWDVSLRHVGSRDLFFCWSYGITRRVAVYLETLQYRLEESVYHLNTRQVTQLFSYLLTHKLFSSYIQWYLLSRACNWVIPALSDVLLTFSSNSVCFSSICRSLSRTKAISMALGCTSTVTYYWTISDNGRCRKFG